MRRRAAAPIRRERSGVKAIDQGRDLRSVLRHQDLGAGFKELLDALPGVGDDAGAGSRRLEHAGGGEKPTAAMLSRVTLSTASAEQLNALWSAV